MRYIHITAGNLLYLVYQFSCFVVQSVSRVQLFATSWTEACQASLPYIVFLSLLKLTFIELMMSSNHLILLPPSHPALRQPRGQCRRIVC